MPDFSKRSYLAELLDAPGIPALDLNRNLYEIEQINKLLGGYEPTLKGIQYFLEKYPVRDEPLRILDVGCGGGDTLRKIALWAQYQNLDVELYGVDLLDTAIAYAKNQKSALPIHYKVSDFREFKADQPFHLAISSLFCHHLDEETLVSVLKSQLKMTQWGVIVNDLQRHPIAYWSIKWLTALFSKSYLVKNDAALSVLKAFKEDDWQEILRNIGVDANQIQWIWAFRYLVIIENA